MALAGESSAPSSTAAAAMPAHTKQSLLADAAQHAQANDYDLALSSLKTALTLDRTDTEVITAVRDLLVEAAKHNKQQDNGRTAIYHLLTTATSSGNDQEGKEASLLSGAPLEAAQKLVAVSSSDPAACQRLIDNGAIELLLPALLRKTNANELLRAALLKTVSNIVSVVPTTAPLVLAYFTPSKLSAFFAASTTNSTTRQSLDLASAVVHLSASSTDDPKDSLFENALAVLTVLAGHMQPPPQNTDTVRTSAFGALIRAIANEQLALALVSREDNATMLFSLVQDSNDKIRGLVPAALVRIFDQVRTTQNRQAVQEAVAKHILTCLESPEPLVKAKGLLALGAVFQANSPFAASIFSTPGLLESLLDCVEMDSTERCMALLELLSSACTAKECRALISGNCMPFLTTMSKHTNRHLSSTAAVTLTKLHAAGIDLPQTTHVDFAAMADSFIAVLLAPTDTDSTDMQSQIRAVEGLAYLTMQPQIKERITAHPTFLKHLIGSTSAADRRATYFGIATILSNLTDFRKKLTQEEEQVRKLRRMAKDAPLTAENADEDSVLNNDDRVMIRGIKVVQHGGVPALLAVASSTKHPDTTPRVRALVARVMCNLAGNKKLHSILVQQGATRALLDLTRPPPSSVAAATAHDPDPDASATTAFFAAHAIAKIAITLDPNLAFQAQLAADLVRPLLALLGPASAAGSAAPLSQLAQFEALMALTNLGSMADPAVRARIVHAGGIPIFENLLFSDHFMIRRAATETLCNMMFQPEVFDTYAAAVTPGFRMILALADADDFPTRRAASGALAILTTAEAACRRIVQETFDTPAASTTSTATTPRGVQIILSLLAPPENAQQLGEAAELQHRGAECVKNMAAAANDIARMLQDAGAIPLLTALTSSPCTAPDRQTAVVQQAAQDAIAAFMNK
ncbi:hypothetical protein PhCBS80983_g00428 [Powellomyces hirtus]|uniref:UNC-45/Cro1/She4 central domain-containing protein n=1 Tax=Powellomyces hirtus TaxID=109895 RepID=A0A507EFW3_9FUNG|nr:hypothetical protein PhCBS80983_g00428 [Powellomyces hirtus]